MLQAKVALHWGVAELTFPFLINYFTHVIYLPEKELANLHQIKTTLESLEIQIVIGKQNKHGGLSTQLFRSRREKNKTANVLKW